MLTYADEQVWAGGDDDGGRPLEDCARPLCRRRGGMRIRARRQQVQKYLLYKYKSTNAASMPQARQDAHPYTAPTDAAAAFVYMLN